MLPSLPPALAEWLPFTAWGVVSVFQGVIWMELKASEVRQVKRTDELRAHMNRQMAKFRADNKVLGEKVDRLVEFLMTTGQT